MSKIYCVFCGTENEIENKKCKKCKKELNPTENLWKDYFVNHIKDELKDKTEDKLSSIITNYITSHLYGIVFSIMFVATAVTGVVSINKNNYIEEVDKNPLEITELSLEDETVVNLLDFLRLNEDGKFKNGFYEDKKVTYEDIIEKNAMAYYYNRIESKEIKFSSCIDAKKYPNIYDLCQEDSSWVVGEYALHYELFEAKLLEEAYKKTYGEDKIFEKNDFDVYTALTCNYYENLDEYICHTRPTGWYNDEAEATKTIKAEKVNDWLEIYDYYVYGGYDGTYKDYKKTQKISDKLVWDNNDLIEKGTIYKHLFKLNKDGEYYWYSSEPIDKID